MTQPLLLRCCIDRVPVSPRLLYISPDASHRHYQGSSIQDQASESIHQHFIKPRVNTALPGPGAINRGHETLTRGSQTQNLSTC